MTDWILVCGGGACPELNIEPISPNIYSLLKNLRRKTSLRIVHLGNWHCSTTFTGDAGSFADAQMDQLLDLLHPSITERYIICPFTDSMLLSRGSPEKTRPTLKPGAIEGENRIGFINYYEHLWICEANYEPETQPPHTASDEDTVVNAEDQMPLAPDPPIPKYRLVPPPNPACPLYIHRNPHITAPLVIDATNGTKLLKCPEIGGESLFGNPSAAGLILLRLSEDGITAYEYSWQHGGAEWETKEFRF